MRSAYRTGWGRLLHWLVAESFVHFVLLGALVFIAYYAINTRAAAENKRIEVNAADIERLRQTALQQWGKEPDAQQMDDLVKSFVREEVLVREALATGLDRDDVVVRRRLAQKMEFLAQDAVRAPSETQLRQYFAEHSADYRQAARLSFEQIYFSPARRGGNALQDARQALVTLQHGGVPAGDAFMLGSAFQDLDQASVARDFGSQFAQDVFALPVGSWSQPVASVHGVHLLRVTALQPEGIRAFEAVRDKVAADALNAQVAAARDGAYRQALARYTVVLPSGEVQLSALPLPVKP